MTTGFARSPKSRLVLSSIEGSKDRPIDLAQEILEVADRSRASASSVQLSALEFVCRGLYYRAPGVRTHPDPSLRNTAAIADLTRLGQPGIALTMGTVNVHEAKTHLSRLLDRVARGEEILIAKNGHPVAKLAAVVSQERVPRRLKGKIKIAKNFDAPLPPPLARAFGTRSK